MIADGFNFARCSLPRTKNSKIRGCNPYYAPGSMHYSDPHNTELQAATILVATVSEKKNIWQQFYEQVANLGNNFFVITKPNKFSHNFCMFIFLD